YFMHYYCDEGNKEIVENLLKNGASVGRDEMLNISPLSIVLSKSINHKLVDLLLHYGAQKEVPCTLPLLCMASYKGDLQKVKWFCENGFYDDNSLNANGIPILCLAAMRHANVVSFLLSYFKYQPK